VRQRQQGRVDGTQVETGLGLRVAGGLGVDTGEGEGTYRLKEVVEVALAQVVGVRARFRRLHADIGVARHLANGCSSLAGSHAPLLGDSAGTRHVRLHAGYGSLRRAAVPTETGFVRQFDFAP
jgi:hypothetical protein